MLRIRHLLVALFALGVISATLRLPAAWAHYLMVTYLLLGVCAGAVMWSFARPVPYCDRMDRERFVREMRRRVQLEYAQFVTDKNAHYNRAKLREILQTFDEALAAPARPHPLRQPWAASWAHAQATLQRLEAWRDERRVAAQGAWQAPRLEVAPNLAQDLGPRLVDAAAFLSARLGFRVDVPQLVLNFDLPPHTWQLITASGVVARDVVPFGHVMVFGPLDKTTAATFYTIKPKQARSGGVLRAHTWVWAKPDEVPEDALLVLDGAAGMIARVVEHLTEQAADLLSLQQVQKMVGDEAAEKMYPVLQGLLRQRIPIARIDAIVEAANAPERAGLRALSTAAPSLAPPPPRDNLRLAAWLARMSHDWDAGLPPAEARRLLCAMVCLPENDKELQRQALTLLAEDPIHLSTTISRLLRNEATPTLESGLAALHVLPPAIRERVGEALIGLVTAAEMKTLPRLLCGYRDQEALTHAVLHEMRTQLRGRPTLPMTGMRGLIQRHPATAARVITTAWLDAEPITTWWVAFATAEPARAAALIHAWLEPRPVQAGLSVLQKTAVVLGSVDAATAVAVQVFLPSIVAPDRSTAGDAVLAELAEAWAELEPTSFLGRN